MRLCYTETVVETRSSLLRRLKDSCDDQSWGEFVALYEPLLLAYVHRKGLGEADARDVVQDILASLFRTLPGFDFQRSRGHFRTWLWRVAQNAITDWARRQTRQRKAEKEWRARTETISRSVASELEIEWEAAHRQRILEFCLERIREETDPERWTCFEKHILEGRPGAEAAKLLGISVNLVYVNASRVLARLRAACEDYMEEPDDAAG